MNVTTIRGAQLLIGGALATIDYVRKSGIIEGQSVSDLNSAVRKIEKVNISLEQEILSLNDQYRKQESE